jgi:predicted phage terminase large subunit-like protein
VTGLAWAGHAASYFEPVRQPYATPGALAQALDPRTVQTPALDQIDAALVDVANGDCDRLMIALSPQEGKSQRTSRRFPLWMFQRNPDLRIAIVSYAHGVARRWGRAIRDDIRDHPELGLTVNPASSAMHEWDLLGHDGSVYCVGITGSLTSRPVDLLIIDDPYKDAQQADSEAWRETVEEFWNEVAIPRLAPGAPVVIIQTRWRENDLSGWLQASETGSEWRVINIPAQADHDPAKGETDPLGREPGEYMISARGRTVADWEKKKREVGSRSWNALYQGRPSPESGDVLKREWWRFYETPLWINRPDGTRWAPLADGGTRMIQSWDMAFKSTASSDWVVGQVWMSDGVHAWLLDQVRGRWSFVETMRAMVQLSARWPQAVLKLVEDKANGPAVISALSRRLPGLVPEEPHGSKQARAAAIAPFIEAGNVHLPDPGLPGCAWVGDLIDEAAAFPNAAHDDQVDTASQALNRLLLTPILTNPDRVVTMTDLDRDVAEYTISAY